MCTRLRRAASLVSHWRAATAKADASAARGFAAAAGCELAVLHRAAHRGPDASCRRAVQEAPSRAKVLLLLLPGGVAAGLGVWQLQRREWKAEQLAERTRQLAAEPLPLSAATASAASEWRRVLCKGELRHDAAAYVRHPNRAAPLLAALHFTRASCAGGASCAQRRRHHALRLFAGASASLLRQKANIISLSS